MCKQVLKICIFLLTAHMSAYADTCMDMYNSFKLHIEPQLTELCDTQFSGYHAFKFYLSDEREGYANVTLVFTEDDSHLYLDSDDIPFKCTDNKVQKMQTAEEILKILFIPQLDNCEAGFKEKVNI